MAKKSEKEKAKAAAAAAVGTSEQPSSLFGASSAFDATLSSLFSSSAGPVRAPVKSYTPQHVKRKHEYETTNGDTADRVANDDDLENDAVLSEASELATSEDEDASSGSNDDDDDVEDDDDEGDGDGDGSDIAVSSDEAVDAPEQAAPERSRKRKARDDNLEGLYLQKLTREDGKADFEDRESKRQRTANSVTEGDLDSDGDESDMGPPPQHETLTKSTPADADADKAARTVFLGNVSTTAITDKAAKRTLLAHLASHLPALPPPEDPTHPHKVESLRFRSTAFAGKIPKKAAFARKDLMEATAKSTNAYAVYSSRAAARTAAKQLNGTTVLGRHLRVDEVAHPAAIDHKRCVFVGNLGFVDDETAMKKAEQDAGYKGVIPKPLKGDVEEGLWRQFAHAGAVESVRVVRDAQTRVGKGFAYVQFADMNAVEAALLYDDKKFPPLLPRKLRVTRAKKPSSTASARDRRDAPSAAAAVPQRNQSAASTGRARKLLGKAGAAASKGRAPAGGLRKPESFVFEGHRATDRQGGGVLKTKKRGGGAAAAAGGKKKKKGARPTGRSAKRGAAWKSQSKATGKA